MQLTVLTAGLQELLGLASELHILKPKFFCLLQCFLHTSLRLQKSCLQLSGLLPGCPQFLLADMHPELRTALQFQLDAEPVELLLQLTDLGVFKSQFCVESMKAMLDGGVYAAE